MTRRPPRQPDHARDESHRRNSTLLNDAAEVDRDQRINEAIRRHFSPPTVWPPLFDRSVNNESVTTKNGYREPSPESGEHGLQRHLRTPQSSWLRRIGIAACLMLGLFGVWNIWSFLNSPQLRLFMPASSPSPPSADIGHLYDRFVADGFLPTDEGEVDEDGRWVISGTPLSIQSFDADAFERNIELLGHYHCDVARDNSPFLFVRVAEKPVVVFLGPRGYRYTADSADADDLYVHRRTVGRFQVYELTPHDSPTILHHIRCDGPDCVPQCASR